jgi:septum formation protein
MKQAVFIYLASQSPRRSQLLNQLGVTFELLLPGQGEDAEALEAVVGDEIPQAYVQRVTGLKLLASLERLKRLGLPVAPVLCADTTVALGHQILGKPANPAEAKEMLGLLSGQTHRVLTAVAIGLPSNTGQESTVQTMLSSSQVEFAELSAAWIDNYVSSGEPMGKAGAYAIQGRAAAKIKSITGSYSGIMGLPLFETVQLLHAFGLEL